MLIRCHADDLRVSLTRARVLAAWFGAHYRVAFAVPRDDFEAARGFLPADAQIYRLPPGDDEEAARLQLLHQKHHHRILLVDHPSAGSAYLFRLQRIFDHLTLFDGGGAGLVHAQVLVNDRFTAASHRYDCSGGVKLLLGPKFHIADPNPLPVPVQQPLHHLLLCLGEPELVQRLLRVLATIEGVPEIHLLCREDDPVRRLLTTLRDLFPGRKPSPVLLTDDGPFPFERYPFVITEADARCPMFAQRRQFFLTVAAHKHQLEEAYAINQLGVAPTLGWAASRTDVELAGLLRGYLADHAGRTRHAALAGVAVDGKGLSRLAHFIPAEKGVGRGESGAGEALVEQDPTRSS